MASISAKFKLIDEMSAKLDKIAQSGRSALSQWEQAGNAIDTAFDGAVTETAQTAQSINTSTDAVEKFSEATTKAADKADEFTTAMDEMENATNASAAASENLSSASDETEEALKGVEESSERAKKKIKDYGEESEDAGGKSKKFGKETTEAIQSIEDLLITVGITKLLKGIGDAFIDCVGDAIEFESAITGVYKTVDGTPEQLAEISDEVKDLALNIPATTTEIAAVAEAAGQLGIATENVMAFSEVMINLGEATNLTSDEAASALAKFTNITGTSAEEYENLGSTIVALGNNFATTEADIVAMSTRMASAATLAGMTESDILALAASLSSVGIEADAGGSSMSTLISKVQLAVETGNDQLEQFASVAGMTADEFSQKWGDDAAQALYLFIAGLQDTERNGASATAVLDEMGITEIRLSNAIKALSNNSDSLGEALNFASGAWEENSALATEAGTRYATLESKLGMTKNAANNLSIAVGDVFTPTISKAAEVGQSALEGLTSLVKACPGLAKGIAVVTAAVATYTAGVTAYVAVKKIATLVQKNFNAAALANPYILLATGIAAVVTAVVLFTDSMNKAEKEMANLTATSRKQAKELDELEKKYDNAVKVYGENSYEAWELRQELDELSESYESSKQTAEEFAQSVEDSATKLREARESYENSATSLDNEYESSTALIAKLKELGGESELAARNQALIIPIINELNSRYEGLGLTFDELTGKFNMTADEMQEVAKSEIDVKQRQADWEEYVRIIGEAPTKLEELNKAQDEMNALEAEYKSIQDEIDGYWLKNWWKAFLGYTEEYAQLGFDAADVKIKMDELSPSLESLREEYDSMIETQKRLEEQYGYVDDATERNGNAFISYEEVVTSSLSSVETRVKELCEVYDEAYEAARESIDGQIGLFDEIVLEVEQTTNEMLGAWESQINYLTSYTENLKKAMEYGFDRSLVEKLSDGSEESAAQLDTIISKVEDLGGTTDKAKKFVDDFNTKFQEVEKAKDEFAEQVADIETDFTGSMKAIEDQLNDSIDKMNMESDAAAAAKATMSGYISEIIAGGNSAVAAAADAAARVRAALQTGVATTSSGGGWTSYADAAAAGHSNIRTATEFARGGSDKNTYGTYQNYLDAMYQKYNGYAEGTDHATAGIHLVGEEGPELVEFAGGETVHTAAETEDIFARTAEAVRSNGISVTGNDTPKQSGSNEPKVIRLEINGEGAIEVDENVDEATVVAILQQHLKPVLTSIVKQEIYEEGDLSYDF